MSIARWAGRGSAAGVGISAAIVVGVWSGCDGGSEVIGDGAGAAPITTTSAGTGPGGAGGTAAAGGSAGAAGGQGLSGGAGGAGGAGAGQVTDFSEPGPFEVEPVDGEIEMEGCGLSDLMPYTLFEPQGGDGGLLVVLGHGFQRSRANMVEMATHLASYGVRVVTPDYCHSSLADSDPEQNAADAIVLADALRAGAFVIHAGYSAGGLAALLAAQSDPSGVALLLLDAVDRDGLGVAAAAHVSVPTFGIDGDPSSCNEQNNQGTHLAEQVAGGWGVHVIGATHCDFEGPTNTLCTLLCGGEGAEGQRELIRWLATAYVTWQAGLDPSGMDWVTDTGVTFQTLVADGAMEPL